MTPGKPVEYFNELDKLFNSIDAEDKETIYLGDTKCDMLDFTNNDTKDLMRLLIKFHLAQHVLQLHVLQRLLLIISLQIDKNLCPKVESCPVVSVIMMLFT